MTDKRKNLINAAVALFAEKGIDATSTQSISKQAGVGTGTLFKYFPSKESLISDSYIEVKKNMLDHIFSGLNPEDPIDSILAHVWNRGIDWTLAHTPEHKFMLQIKNSPYAKASEHESIRNRYQFFQLAVKTAMREGLFEEIPVEIAELCFSTFWSMTIEYLQKSGQDPEEARSLMFSLLMKSLKKQPASLITNR